MLGNEGLSDDDYVAKLLAQDAKKSSQRYAAVGLSALLPQRSTKSAPKPNTRFLNHIVREADSHNAALKKKEELEARIRLREMKERDRRAREDKDNDRERKRRRIDARDEDRLRHRRRRSRDGKASPSPGRDKTYSRHRDRDGRRKDDKEKQRAGSQREYSDNSDDNKYRDSLRRRRHSSDRNRNRNQDPAATRLSMSESDPLEDIIDSLPSKSRQRSTRSPVRIRGRGALTSSQSKSNIDAHFSPTYDPSHDIRPEDELMSEREDWDMALEALRDRAMWKKKQSDRLREVGFGDEDIRKWEKSAAGPTPGTGDGDLRDVRWVKKGEKRAWDIGKKAADDSGQ